MLLAVDIGNSDVVAGITDLNRGDGGDWITTWRLRTVQKRSAEGWQKILSDCFKSDNLDPTGTRQVIISSVVPQVTNELQEAVARLTKCEPHLLSWRSETGIELGTGAPAEIGTDLIANAVAAYQHVEDTCLVVDFGTATTIMAVRKPEVLAGGAICAGLETSLRSLSENAAQLPEIPLEVPGSMVAGNTLEAMQSGVVWGHICMVEGMIFKMKQELGRDSEREEGQAGLGIKVVATGGLVSRLAPHTDIFDFTDPMLTLNGLRFIAERQG